MNLVNNYPISLIVLCSGFALIIISLWGMLSRRHLIRIILGFSLMDTGIHMIMISIGYITGGTAPILNDAVALKDATKLVVDPVPSALVLTSIVIGLGVTAIMLAYVVRIRKTHNTLMIDELTESKW